MTLMCAHPNLQFFKMKWSISQRAHVQILRDLGYSQSVIAHKIKKSKSFVKYWWSRGDIVKHQNAGRSSKITRSLLKKISNRVTMKKRSSIRILARVMEASHESIHKGLKKLHLFPHRTQTKPLLTKNTTSERFKFSKQLINHDFSKTLFIDEKKIILIPHPNRKNDIIWAPRGAVIPYVPTVKFPVSLNVAAGISENGRTDIFIFKQIMDSKLFIDILQSTIIPGAKKIIHGNWELFLDKDPKHTSKLTTSFLHENHIPLIQLPTNSPDLNPIENV